MIRRPPSSPLFPYPPLFRSYVFTGAAVASFLTEVVGMLVAIIAPGASSSIAALKIAMGGFGVLAVVAVILGATTANVLNLYSNTMSAQSLDVRLPRWQLAILGRDP